MDVRIYEQDYERAETYLKGFYAGIKRGKELAYQDISKRVEEIQNEPFARNGLTNAEKILIALMGIVLILWGIDQLRPQKPQMTFSEYYGQIQQKDEKQAYIGSQSL